MDIKKLKSITKKLNVIYIEDSRCVSKISMELFEDIFNRVDLAEDGMSALKKYKSSKYDLVICDINLPKINGLEVIKKILKIDENQAIVIISAYSELEYFSIMQEMNIKYFLKKPVNSKSLFKTIYKSIEHLEDRVDDRLVLAN